MWVKVYFVYIEEGRRSIAAKDPKHKKGDISLISQSLANQALNLALSKGGDFAELFI